MSTPFTALTTPRPPQAPPVEASGALRIDLTTIVPSKTNPRTSFTAPDIAELAASIRKHDIFQPLLLRPHPTRANVLELVDGERRYRAAKEAGLQDVPAIIGSFTDEQVLEMQIVSFLQRKDLTALEEANAYNAFLVRHYKHEHIAEKVGRSVQYVRDRCRLLSLVKGAQELLAKGRIEVGHAILLARLSPEDQIRIIREPEINNYGGEQSSGLWQRQRALPKTSEQMAGGYDEEEEAIEGENDLKAVSVRELHAWIDKHVKLQPTAPETAELFPEVAQVVAKAAEEKVPGEKPLKVLHITFEHVLPDDVKKVDGPRVYGPRSWVRADGKAGSKECASAAAGIVVAGPGRGEAFLVCINKKACMVHYKDEILAARKRETEVNKSGATAAARAAIEKAKREADELAAKEAQARLARALPAIRLAVAEKIKVAPLAKLQAEILLAVRCSMKDASKLLPGLKGTDGWIRQMALGCVLDHIPDSNIRWMRQHDVASDLKPWGVDLAKIVASANANDAATKAARKKPAKAKK